MIVAWRFIMALWGIDDEIPTCLPLQIVEYASFCYSLPEKKTDFAHFCQHHSAMNGRRRMLLAPICRPMDEEPKEGKHSFVQLDSEE